MESRAQTTRSLLLDGVALKGPDPRAYESRVVLFNRIRRVGIHETFAPEAHGANLGAEEGEGADRRPMRGRSSSPARSITTAA